MMAIKVGRCNANILRERHRFTAESLENSEVDRTTVNPIVLSIPERYLQCKIQSMEYQAAAQNLVINKDLCNGLNLICFFPFQFISIFF